MEQGFFLIVYMLVLACVIKIIYLAVEGIAKWFMKRGRRLI